MRDVIQRLSFIVFILFLTACAGAATRAAPSSSPTVGGATRTPSTQTSPAPATAESTADAAQPTTDVAPTPAEYNGIPQGVTDEGFYRLGDAAAPVTLIDYSDFL